MKAIRLSDVSPANIEEVEAELRVNRTIYSNKYLQAARSAAEDLVRSRWQCEDQADYALQAVSCAGAAQAIISQAAQIARQYSIAVQPLTEAWAKLMEMGAEASLAEIWHAADALALAERKAEDAQLYLKALQSAFGRLAARKFNTSRKS